MHIITGDRFRASFTIVGIYGVVPGLNSDPPGTLDGIPGVDAEIGKYLVYLTGICLYLP